MASSASQSAQGPQAAPHWPATQPAAMLVIVVGEGLLFIDHGPDFGSGNVQLRSTAVGGGVLSWWVVEARTTIFDDSPPAMMHSTVNGCGSIGEEYSEAHDLPIAPHARIGDHGRSRWRTRSAVAGFGLRRQLVCHAGTGISGVARGRGRALGTDCAGV